jgi:hypothetical protein
MESLLAGEAIEQHDLDIALLLAAEAGQLGVTGLLMTAGADSSAEDYKALRLALAGSHSDVVKLLRFGCKP